MGRRFNTYFSKDISGQEVHENCSTLLIIREMKIKTTMRNYLTLIRRATLKNLWAINAGEGVE